ncbi:NAD-dependent aldehyde dehydrogenase [Spongiibacter sp. IMCC21906]|uniref:aldehyde dehydrogenase n=1 Tax=Spongiibacter sp. IMCC21906 TaxID=1620392 RepID=UPI00062DCD2D|nr:aldehyde dehydrogenase [Spongiibacter sp. IMCC21906]AKH70332.1 NAD-dependent aldehyde dehydrogenase [Spongiibacter sp. IMCC21906]
MNTKISHAEVPLAHPDCLFIDGAWVKPLSGKMFDIKSPATEALYMQVAEASEDDINLAVTAARNAFDSGPWSQMTHAKRASYLRAMADELAKRSDDVANIWPNEMGIVHAVAGAFSATIPDVYRYYADLSESFPFEEAFPNPPGGGEIALLVKEPVGVVGTIIPWNAPINIMAYTIAPALLAGCTVVLKSSPEAPGGGYIMAEIAEAIGLPAGVLNVVTADREASERLVRHPGVDKISFTGSNVAGRKIGAICADRIARCTLELGGKSAAVILDDYDLKEAAEAIGSFSCFLSGQVCSSLTRVIVTKDRHDEFVAALTAVYANIKIGDPFDPETQLGPLVSERQLARVEEYIEIAKNEGATLAFGGERPADLDQGFYIQPTLFSNVGNDFRIAREEVFGPVLCVIPAENEEHAIELANDTVFGLNNSVFTNNIDRAYAVARQLRSGTVGHNVFRSDMMIGFGGFKQSGIGRQGGVAGLAAYLENKTVILNDIPSHVV